MRPTIQAVTMYVVVNKEGRVTSAPFNTPEEALRSFMEEKLAELYYMKGVTIENNAYMWATSIINSYEEIRNIMEATQAAEEPVERKISV